MDQDSVQYWMEQVKDVEMRFTTYKEANAAAVERVKAFKANFGIKEKSDGEIVIDYDKFVKSLGLSGSMELRKVIDDTYNVTGDAGEKPHIKLANG